MKTILQCLILTALLLGCSTLKAPVAEIPATPQAPGKFELPNIDYKGEPELTGKFNEALRASRDQEWSRLIELLKQLDRATGPLPRNESSIHFALLEKLTKNGFAGEAAVGAVLELLSESDRFPEKVKYFQALQKLYRESPPSLEWAGEEAVLNWESPSWWSFMERLGYSLKFHPLVEVEVNGVKLKVVVDTGAETSLFMEDAARKAGIQTIPGLVITMGDSNEKESSAQLGVAENMVLGSLKARNTQVFITTRTFGQDGFDGIIGWDLLSQLVVEMDSRAKKITLRPSRAEKGPDSNFFWIGDPLIGLRSDRGEDLFFFLDTGSAGPNFAERTLKNLGARFRVDGQGFSGGINGMAAAPRVRVEEVRLNLDGKTLTYKDFRNNTMVPFQLFTWWAGRLGSDIAQAGVLTLDFPSARVTFLPYSPVARWFNW